MFRLQLTFSVVCVPVSGVVVRCLHASPVALDEPAPPGTLHSYHAVTVAMTRPRCGRPRATVTAAAPQSARRQPAPPGVGTMSPAQPAHRKANRVPSACADLVRGHPLTPGCPEPVGCTSPARARALLLGGLEPRVHVQAACITGLSTRLARALNSRVRPSIPGGFLGPASVFVKTVQRH